MKVLLVNGSSRENGCTYQALCEVQRALNEENIETEEQDDGHEDAQSSLAKKIKETANKIAKKIKK